MSDDLLGRAVDALRETSEEPNRRSGLTRARLLESAEKQKAARGRRGARILLGVFGLFVAGNALARVAEYFPAVMEVFAPAPAAAPSRPSAAGPRKPRGAARPAAGSAPAAAPEVVLAPQPAPNAEAAARAPAPSQGGTPTDIAPPPAHPRPRQRPAKTVALAAPAPVSAPAPAAPRAESAELVLFRRAQALHLAHAEGALAAWDAYLRVAGSSVLLPEARYNRALCLVRLQGTVEARAALEPFARGEFGDYRRREARALLEALATPAR